MTPQPMATWLARQLVRDGVMTSDRVTKHAKPRRCPRCHLFVLVGLDDLLPSKISVDLHATTTAGEAFAVLCGRASYGMDHGELFCRYATRLAFKPADANPVYVQHDCHSPALPINPRFIPQPTIAQTGDVPF